MGDFVVTLIAKDEWGVSSDPVTKTVHIEEPAGNVAPAAVINTPSCNAATKTCNFSAGGTTDALGDAITYAWNFGDGTPAGAGANTAHTFAAGTYTVTLTATDGWGKSAQKTVDVTIAP